MATLNAFAPHPLMLELSDDVKVSRKTVTLDVNCVTNLVNLKTTV